MENLRHWGLVVTITVSAILLMLCVGPLEIFTHGNYCDIVEYSDIDQEDFKGQVKLGEDPFIGEFAPVKRHFVGLALCLTNVPQDANGTVTVLLTDSKGRVLDTKETALNKVAEEKWYRVYLDANLKVGSSYYYAIKVQECDIYPGLPIVNSDYLGDESVDSDILIGYI